jgi:hypothetical protein
VRVLLAFFKATDRLFIDAGSFRELALGHVEHAAGRSAVTREQSQLFVLDIGHLLPNPPPDKSFLGPQKQESPHRGQDGAGRVLGSR